MENNALRIAAIGLLTGFLVLQAIPWRSIPEARSGLPIESVLAVPADVRQMFGTACADCHARTKAFPWYARIAPISWLIQSDIEAARSAMDLSDWTRAGGQSHHRTIGTLMAACASMQAGVMPPPSYRVLHPDARLSGLEIANFCAWTSATVREMRTVAGRTPAGGASRP